MTDRLELRIGGEDGREQVVHAARGTTVLAAAHDAGVEITATCGARGRCRSCRVKVLSGAVPPPTLQDGLQLGFEAVQENFRLACQTKLLEDTLVRPMPPKAESGYQILGGQAATTAMALDSGVEKQVISVEPPKSEHHQTSDLDEVFTALGEALVSREVAPELVRDLPAKLRARKGELTATLFRGRLVDLESGDTSGQAYGMAFDIGTTSIVGSLLDLASGEELAAVGTINPQAPFGADLMSRIAHAQFNPKNLQQLRGKALNALNDLIKQACAEAEVSPAQIYKIVVVGNTCMHHILLGIDVSYLGLAPYAPVIRDAQSIPAGALPLKTAPRAHVCTLPVLAGFVGADALACVLSTRIYDSQEIRVLVDIGTNGEMVIGSRDRLVACSAPAGPAFEGAQIRHGMRGALGAIERIRIDDDVSCDVIGGHAAIGICGSGLIEACARMAEVGVISPSGALARDPAGLPDLVGRRLVKHEHGPEFVLVWGAQSGKGEDITLTQGDIRQLQLAKSAIFSGVAMLQKEMAVAPEQVEELMLCGGFGNYVDVASAVRIRLLPEMPVERISYVGNAALMGAQMALLSEGGGGGGGVGARRRAGRPDRARRLGRAPGLPGALHRRHEFRIAGQRAGAEDGGDGMTRKTRIDLLFGFLGSGKTTLARQILETWGPKRRMALIVNEFGDVGVDGDILSGNNIDLIQLSSGCLCCTLKGSLLAAVDELAAKAPLDHIVIESTGVAEPEEVLSSFSEPGFLERYEVGPVVTVVDTPKYLKIREMLGPFYEAQVEKADLVILNKLDLATTDLAEEVREEVDELNESAVVRYAERCDIDLLEVLDGPSSGALTRYGGDHADAGRDHDHHHDHDHDHDHDHEHGGMHAPAESFVLDAPEPLDRHSLEALFAKAPEGLWRAKGFVKLGDADALLQFAMGELEITPAEGRERHYLVFIGDHLDRDWFARELAAVRARDGVA